MIYWANLGETEDSKPAERAGRQAARSADQGEGAHVAPRLSGSAR